MTGILSDFCQTYSEKSGAKSKTEGFKRFAVWPEKLCKIEARKVQWLKRIIPLKRSQGWMWWNTPVIPAPGKMRQLNHEF
jgi:hypothetical protein